MTKNMQMHYTRGCWIALAKASGNSGKGDKVLFCRCGGGAFGFFFGSTGSRSLGGILREALRLLLCVCFSPLPSGFLFFCLYFSAVFESRFQLSVCICRVCLGVGPARCVYPTFHTPYSPLVACLTTGGLHTIPTIGFPP